MKLKLLKELRVNRAMKTIVTVFAGGLFLCEQAQAVPITGAIQFFGSSIASGPSGPPDTIHFINPWHSVAATGSYSVVLTGTNTTFNDFSFIGDGTAATLIGTDSPIWTFTIGATTYSFDLLTLTDGHVDAGSMGFSGTGIAHITGLDDTPASFGLEGDGTGGFNFQLSSSTTGATTPEGGTTVVMLAFGLALIGIMTLRQKLAA
jgi:hypothetical protein